MILAASWIFVWISVGFISATPNYVPSTEAQCKAMVGDDSYATKDGQRLAACLSPDGAWWPGKLGHKASANADSGEAASPINPKVAE
jgi:hypothetical protein